MVLAVDCDLNSNTHLIPVTVRCGVLFEVRTEFLNIIYTSFGFKGLSEVNKLLQTVCHSVYFTA
jgi:hypothetical protein